MGRYSGYGYKTTTDGLLYLDMPKLKEFRLLKGNVVQRVTWTSRYDGARSRILLHVNIHAQQARLTYTSTDKFTNEKSDYDYQIKLESTPCNLGGYRWWFICPLIVNGIYCGRRVRKLYKGSDYFGCRACQQLCYSSQNNTSKYRDFYLAEDLAERAEQLYLAMKTPFYKGMPTRKMKRYQELVKRSNYYAARLVSFDDLLGKM